MGVGFIEQNMFEDCRNIHPLPFDFYLPDYNTLIEYDGRGHFRVVEHWGGKRGFETRQKCDKIKTDYAAANGITLIRIPYWEKANIKTLLSEALGL